MRSAAPAEVFDAREPTGLEDALQYAARGLLVLPIESIDLDGRCTCGAADCASPAKHPVGNLTPRGLHDATNDAEIIRRWFDQRPGANVGIRTGGESGLVVLDEDLPYGEDSRADLEARYGELPDTPRVLTGGGGEQYFFRHPGYRIPCSTAKLGVNLDVRADGGYVVAPYSLHRSGRLYEWDSTAALGELEPAPLPSWLAELMTARSERTTESTQGETEIPAGKRNDQLTRIGGALRRRGCGFDEILAALKVTNEQRCRPPLADTEVAEIARSVGRYAPEPGAADRMSKQWDGMETGDSDGTARRLTLSPRLTRDEMLENPIQFLCPNAHFLAPGVSTLITSIGGTGKTRMILQILDALSRGLAPFGCELLRPPRPMECIYIGAEDHQRFFNYLALPLFANGTDTLPFDTVLLPEIWPGFTLNRTNARTLALFLEAYRAEHGLDCVALDPMVSLIGSEYADMMKNPVVSRAFFNDCIAPLLASQAFALLSANHDSKAGAAVAGSGDQQNVARCVLQLSTEGTSPDGTTTIAADRHKDNLGFRFSKLILERDPNTLLLTWNPTASVYAYGAPAGHTAPAGPSRDPADVMRYLCRQATRLIDAPADQRIKGNVEARLNQQAARDGVNKIRESVRQCVSAFCDFEPDPSPRRGRRLLLVGVRNPDAGMNEHDDYLAGHAATETEAE